MARGLAHEENGDMEAALADFTQAVQVYPDSVAGLRDQASVLSEKLGRNREALAPLNRLIELYPAYARGVGRGPWCGRGLGWRDEALADVQKALELDPVSGRQPGAGRLRLRPDERRIAGGSRRGVPVLVPGAAKGPRLGRSAPTPTTWHRCGTTRGSPTLVRTSELCKRASARGERGA